MTRLALRLGEVVLYMTISLMFWYAAMGGVLP
jgi:hypothetical protein